jgi:hypothetical protein
MKYKTDRHPSVVECSAIRKNVSQSGNGGVRIALLDQQARLFFLSSDRIGNLFRARLIASTIASSFSAARKVRWIAAGVPSEPRVTSVTIAGHLLPDGCFNPA